MEQLNQNDWKSGKNVAIIGNSIVLTYPRYSKGAPVTVTKRKGFEGRTNGKKKKKGISSHTGGRTGVAWVKTGQES